VSIRQVISDVLTAVRPTLERLQVRVAINLAPEFEEVLIDRPQFEQALIALVTNAAEASSPGQTVQISAGTSAQVKDAWELQVQDQGCGIPSELMDKVFLPFFTTKRQGNGIGLSLVKAIVHQHGGTLSVSSRANRGSCFTITMPAPTTRDVANFLSERP
jgi:signal transduction histidine kinase